MLLEDILTQIVWAGSPTVTYHLRCLYPHIPSLWDLQSWKDEECQVTKTIQPFRETKSKYTFKFVRIAILKHPWRCFMDVYYRQHYVGYISFDQPLLRLQGRGQAIGVAPWVFSRFFRRKNLWRFGVHFKWNQKRWNKRIYSPEN